MATKPLTLPRPWATLANYDTGPFIGQPMKVNPGVGIAASGHRPGAAFPTPAEYENFQQNQITAVWIPWVNAGSFTGAADAHLVETAATGRSQLQGLTLDDAVNETVLNVTGVNTVAPAVLVTAGTGPAIQAIIDPDSFAFTSTVGAGTGSVFSAFLDNTLAGGAGLDVTDNAGANGDGVRVVRTGNGVGIRVTTAGSDTIIVSGGTITASPAAGGNGMEILGGSGPGVGAIRASNPITNVSGTVISAETSTNANSTGRGLVGEAHNNAIGIEGIADDNNAGLFRSTGTATAMVVTAAGGIGVDIQSNGSGLAGNFALQVRGDTTSPVVGTISIVDQNARPTTGLSGHLTSITSASLKLGLCGGNSDNTWRSYWHSLNGYACAYDLLPNTTTVGGIGVWKFVGTITTSSVGNQIKVASSTVLLRVSMTPRAVTAAATGPTLGVLVEDTTSGIPPYPVIYQRVGAGTGDTSGFKMDDNTNIWQNSIAFMIPVVVPAIGTRSYRLSITTSSVTEIRVRDVTMDFVGTVD